MVAGVAIGTHTPGFTADPGTVGELADIGVILLMFAICIQLSVRDLARDARVAVIGGHMQIALLLGAGFGVAQLAGWDWRAALFFGAVVSNSSSTVLSKLLGERGQERSTHGRLALASTVQDLNTVVLVVALTALTCDGTTLGTDLIAATSKTALFLTLLVPVGGGAWSRWCSSASHCWAVVNCSCSVVRRSRLARHTSPRCSGCRRRSAPSSRESR